MPGLDRSSFLGSSDQINTSLLAHSTLLKHVLEPTEVLDVLNRGCLLL